MNNLVKNQKVVLFVLGTNMCEGGFSKIKSVGQKFITLENGIRRPVNGVDKFIPAELACEHQLINAWGLTKGESDIVMNSPITEAVELFHNKTKKNKGLSLEVITNLRNNHILFTK